MNTCETCKFWCKEPAYTKGECRRFPPSLYTTVEGDSSNVRSNTPTGFPDTRPDDWCGEHQGK